jgi:hypothetical protein
VFIEKSIEAVYEVMAEAMLLVVLVIFFFLRSARATLIPFVTIPVSLIGAFFLIWIMGFTINVLTLLGVVLAMHTFPSREALTPEWAERIARTRGIGDGLLFTDEAVVYSPGQFLSNIVFSMEPSIDASEALGFIFEAMTWLTTVLMTGWLDKFPRLRAAVLESNATWLPLVLARSRNFLDLYAFQRGPVVRDPVEAFYERCFIAFEGDEESVYRLWDQYENVGLWSSDYPHHDAEDAWEALELMAKHRVPVPVQHKLLGDNARRLYGIDPVLAVTERIEHYEPAKLPW